MPRNATDGLTDEEVLELTRDSARGNGATKFIHRFFMEAQFTAGEIRTGYDMMNWLFTSPGLTWASMTQKFQELFPSRNTDDLAALIRAVGKDAPGTPLVRLIPK